MTSKLTRRDFVAGTVVAGATIAIASHASAAGHGSGHQHHGHHHHDHKAKHAELAHAAHHCIHKGEICMDHCLKLVAAGDTTIAKCMQAVRLMIPVCGAVSTHAQADSQHLKALVKSCIAVCKDCKAACDAHADHHPECKACAASCAAMIKEGEKLLAA